MGTLASSSNTPNVDNRNVIDHYKYWKTEAIKADLERKRCQRVNNFSVLCCNWQNDFNIGGVIRNANAFLASQIFIYGRKRYDKRGAVGTHHYENFSFVKEITDLNEILEKYTVVAIDNVEGAQSIDSFEWPDNPLMVFGQESIGVEPELLESADSIIYIPQYGSVRSLNVACASAVMMNDWCRKNA